MQEIEVKILEIDKNCLIKKLKNIWAKKVFDSKIEAFFYKNKDWKDKEKQNIDLIWILKKK